MAYGYRFWLGLKDGCILGFAEGFLQPFEHGFVLLCRWHLGF
jgi:hypothetical protein